VLGTGSWIGKENQRRKNWMNQRVAAVINIARDRECLEFVTRFHIILPFTPPRGTYKARPILYNFHSGPITAGFTFLGPTLHLGSAGMLSSILTFPKA
jgi:hypothetical protein